MRLTIHTDYTLRVLMQPALPREHLATTADVATHAPNIFQAILDNCAAIALARPRHCLSAPFRPKKPRLP
jgi:hypothetical protein